MKGEQLELFSGTKPDAVIAQIGKNHVAEPKPTQIASLFWKAPNNSVVPFPADRQVAYVIKIARALDGRDERLAAKYWRTEVNRLTGRLQVQGFDAATIRAEVVRFGNAVALHRVDDGRERPTGGAA